MAQEPGGRELLDVLEAYEFYHAVLAADGPTRHQKLRAQKRLMLLACGRSKRARNRPAQSAAAQGEVGLRRAWRKKLVAKAAREPDNPEAQHLAAIASGQESTLGVALEPVQEGGESHVARTGETPVAHTRSGAAPQAVGADMVREPAGKLGSPLVETPPARFSDSSRVTYRSSILPAQWWDVMDAAVAAAPPGADTYKVAVDTYLQLKYPGWKSTDASPSLPDSSGTDGQSSDAHARAPPPGDTAA